MSKIHLEIEIPGNAKTYEFVLDDRMKIGTAKEQIKKQIAELEGHDLFAGLDNIVFGSLELEGLIQDNETFREVGIKNGSRVVMVLKRSVVAKNVFMEAQLQKQMR